GAQSKDVNERKNFVLPEVSKGNKKIVLNHNLELSRNCRKTNIRILLCFRGRLIFMTILVTREELVQ
ncbi:MAG: hypothetical protein C0490_22030, partial [Marivirga sp.]|nr:hypothetical protein [Marivirga sp.]